MPKFCQWVCHSVDSSFDKHKGRFVVYVDNIAVFGLDAETVDNMMGTIKIRLHDSGLLTHDPCACQY